jgi:hypothetical protein
MNGPKVTRGKYLPSQQLSLAFSGPKKRLKKNNKPVGFQRDKSHPEITGLIKNTLATYLPIDMP